MKQFKKWLLTDKGQLLVGDYRAEAAWRAALEWVLNDLEVDVSGLWVETVRKELKD